MNVSDNYYVNLSQKLPWKLLLYLSSYGKIGRSPSDVYTMRHQQRFIMITRISACCLGDSLF